MPRGLSSAQRQNDTNATSDKDDSPKGEEIWDTNKQLFPAWYPTLIRALNNGPTKFQLYAERLVAKERHLVRAASTPTIPSPWIVT